MVSYKKLSDRLPRLTHHKASGQGIVRLDVKDVHCGRFGTVEFKARCLRDIGDWEAASLRRASDAAKDPSVDTSNLTINEVILSYRGFADSYCLMNGRRTSEPGNIRLAIRPLCELNGHILAREFGPSNLKTVCQAMVEAGHCRNEINRRVRLIVRAFKWAVAEAMVSPSVHHGLKAVEGMKKGRCGVRESAPVRAVPDE
jgi:hypothetical protein